MYNPKINDEYIPVLYQIAKECKKPMTAIVNKMIAKAIAKHKEAGACLKPETTTKEV